ncbi:MAG: prepilin-type N-terminal cleavage/methylation domain-containing protein [Gemmatimonadetes bacterium]|nr:prepilin-type N-terminal cleavage/methylation domain-containing protein [Gemmatimonadota bacterium]NIT68179.1 prepilin-type N-terminal cleavage/methylation domain-containing protein [Gemmatimonadota bacterium]NIY36756.1 prepilin-type N-terminal cleavage/methylation domain-containing protein [Gemmatimonadota bacterium]
MCRSSKRGFTMAELLVVIVLGTIVVGALYQVLVYQQRLYTNEQVMTVRHDALRLAANVLAADLMEASASEGDFQTLEPDRLSLRSPVGFAVACGVDTLSSSLSFIDASGRFSAAAGDSLLVYHPAGWLVRSAGSASEASDAGPGCAYSGGPTARGSLSVAGSINGVPVGAPIRAFHRYTYSLQQDDGSWWLARDDGSNVDLLAGPFAGDGSGLTFVYRDESGAETSDPNSLVRLDMRLVSQAPGGIQSRDTLTATVRLRNQ